MNKINVILSPCTFHGLFVRHCFNAFIHIVEAQMCDGGKLIETKKRNKMKLKIVTHAVYSLLIIHVNDEHYYMVCILL